MSATASSAGNNKRALLVLIVDISPTTWGERDLKRTANDKRRLAEGKAPVKIPATLGDTITAVEAFCGAFGSLEEDGIVMVIVVAGKECAVVYPRKNDLHAFFNGAALDSRKLKEGLTVGTSELMARAAKKAEAAQEDSSKRTVSNASIAAALSLALCSINRFLVAANSGVSALANASPAMYKRDNDGTVVSLATTENAGKGDSPSAWSPRILIVQASQDRSRDYNALMNCVFAASKYNIEINGCFIPSGIAGDATCSAFLEQACDRTNGVYLAPSGRSQAEGALTEILLSVFLPPPGSRSALCLPAINKVDFRAQCFETGENVDMAFVCNQCLSIFKNKPTDYCPTCGADIIKVMGTGSYNNSNNKRQRTSAA